MSAQVLIRQDTTLRKISEEDHVVAGYASVEEIDKQNELITLDALRKAWSRFWGNKEFAVNTLMHSNIPVGRVIESYTEKDGTIHTSGVDDTGLYIVSKIRMDIKKGRETWDMIERGVLRSFSIAGERLHPEKVVCDSENSCFSQIDDVELHEISIVDNPANKASTFKILKRDKEMEKPIILVKDFCNFIEEYEPINSEVMETMKNEWIEKKLWNPKDFDEDGFNKRVLTTEAREKIPKVSFACTTASGEKKLPIHDAAHTRNAMARYNQAQGCQTAQVRAKICRAAKKFGIKGGTFCGKTKKFVMDDIIGKPFAGFKDFAACVTQVMRDNPKYTREQAQGTCAKIHHTATGKYPSQKGDYISYDLALIRGNPVHRVLTKSGESASVSQDREACERTPTPEDEVGSRIEIKIKGDAKWVKKLQKMLQ